MQFERLGPYRIGERLGKGGMGAVYRAVHVETGDQAAVKALSPQLAMAEGFRERFEAEIESLKKLRHPGIVRLYGYGEQDGFLFYAMELVEGTSLEEELARGRRFSWREVADFGIQICRALKHAHDHGVIHRDIKPANLLLDQEGNIKIADFGIARLFGGTQLTTAGGVLGTADYMSPEQADGRNVTERCDQYSLGGVMYAVLAGRPPFRAKNLPEMLQLQRFAEPESVRRFAPDTPLQMERLIMQLLSKDPADRFPNVLALARHMEAMVKALSRPTADDFALQHQESAEEALEPSGIDESISLQATRLETELSDVGSQAADTPPEASPTEMDDVAEEEAASGLTGPLTNRIVVDEELEVEPPSRSTAPRRTTPPIRRQTHFTTVEDEALHGQDDERQSWLVTASQWVVLLGVLGLLGYALWHFTRPATADQLYEAIAEAASAGKAETLRTVEEELDEFAERFPNDPRITEVQGFLEQIELSRTQRRLEGGGYRRTRGQPLLAVEQMFLDAQQVAESHPTEAIARLEAILALYSPAANVDGADGKILPAEDETLERVSACLRLVRRRLTELRLRVASQSEHQLPELERRLVRAKEIAEVDKARARAMLEALVLLTAEKPWAEDIARRARRQLEALGAREMKTGAPPDPSTTVTTQPSP